MQVELELKLKAWDKKGTLVLINDDADTRQVSSFTQLNF